MKRIFTTLKTVLFSIGLLMSLSGCEDHQARYLDPPWLGGSNIETLEGKGNYKIFLQLMEKSGYKTAIDATLFTLFVPNDAAFEKYFQEAGISSVDAMTKEQAKELFTLHILRNPRSRFQLIYEFVWSELQGPDGEYAGLFFRKPTYSTSQYYYEYVRYDPAFQGDTLMMYTGEKLMPLFSTDYFEDFFGDPTGSDYLFMYRDSEWGNNLNWGPAMVTEAEVRTANGFIYYIDRVVPPQINIDQYLNKNQTKYGVFYDLLQRFGTYGSPRPDPYTQKIAYLKTYDLVSNLAEEQGAFTGNEVRMKDMYTLYLPTDAVLQNYLDNTVLKFYSSLDSVPKITLYYILQTQIGRSLGLISKLEKSAFNAFGDPMTITKSMISDAHMCSNGVVYEMNTVLEPNVFTCVPGKLFFDKNYSTLLYTINAANLTASLAVPEVKVTLFAPDNDAMEEYGVRYDPLADAIKWRGRDGVFKNIRTDDMLMIVQDHIYNGELPDLTGDGYLKMSSGNFVKYSNGTVYAGENQILNDPSTIVEKNVNDRNGILYTVDNCIKSKYVLGKYITSDPDFSKFMGLLVSTKLLDAKYIDMTTKDTLPNLRFLSESPAWTGFIPTNAAMDAAQAAGIIPTNTDTLKMFLQYHFVRKEAIFDDGSVSGSVSTQRIESVSPIEGTKYAQLSIANTPENLVITDHSGESVTVNHATANNLVRKGVAHKITKVLKY